MHCFFCNPSSYESCCDDLKTDGSLFFVECQSAKLAFCVRIFVISSCHRCHICESEFSLGYVVHGTSAGLRSCFFSPYENKSAVLVSSQMKKGNASDGRIILLEAYS